MIGKIVAGVAAALGIGGIAFMTRGKAGVGDAVQFNLPTAEGLTITNIQGEVVKKRVTLNSVTYSIKVTEQAVLMTLRASGSGMIVHDVSDADIVKVHKNAYGSFLP